MKTVLLLESVRANGTSFAPHLERRYHLFVAHTGKVALELAQQHQPDIMVLDAASLRTSGDRICATLKNEVSELPIIHIKMEDATTDSVADVQLHHPLTYRKLYNRIERYTCLDHGHTLEAGPLQLKVQQSLLTTPTGEKKLTPKLSKMMEVFLQQPGQIVDRETLMREVWNTDYMGDTRTLDVHIRWVRQALEENPNKPQYLKTVRGKGYILDVS